MRISPIRYMGNKNKLIKKGLIELFPKEINIFYDLFGGSGAVCFNTEAKQYLLNDSDKYMYELYSMFKNKTADNILDELNNRIDKFNLPRFSTDIRRLGMTKEIRDFYKDRYMVARETLNENLKPVDVLFLMYYSMSTTIRINPNTHKYNMPFGNGYFIESKHGAQIVEFSNWLKNNNVALCNKDYKKISIEDSLDNFVYLDPPYLNSTATYNENGKWNITHQRELLDYCSQLNKKNIKFGMSNTFQNKGKTNEELISWVKENNLNVHYFDDFDYCTFGTGRSNTVEVYIYNY